MTPRTLFMDGDLREYLGQAQDRVRNALQAYDPDKLLLTAEADVVDYLVDMGQVEELRLHRDEAYTLDPTEVTKQTRNELTANVGGWRAPSRVVTRWTLVVPLSGDPKLLGLRASTYTLAPPMADISGRTVRIDYDSDSGGSTADAVRGYFDRTLTEIENQLGYTNKDIANHNASIARDVPGGVAARRAKHLADKELQANLGFPIKRRDDAAGYSVPVNRRQLTPKRPPPQATESAFAPEPLMADGDYEAALEVLRNGRNALERSPSTTSKLSEEEIRDLLLVLLNGQFKGQASGELFNGSGKTDILVRVEDRNVFIGECKFWGGPKKFTAALNQLLSYTTWRDTKAALLIFVKQGDVTAITQKSVAAVREHPNYKRDGRHANDERHDFVLHINGDTNRELRLAVMIFVISPSHAAAPDEQ